MHASAARLMSTSYIVAVLVVLMGHACAYDAAPDLDTALQPLETADPEPSSNGTVVVQASMLPGRTQYYVIVCSHILCMHLWPLTRAERECDAVERIGLSLETRPCLRRQHIRECHCRPGRAGWVCVCHVLCVHSGARAAMSSSARRRTTTFRAITTRWPTSPPVSSPARVHRTRGNPLLAETRISTWTVCRLSCRVVSCRGMMRTSGCCHHFRAHLPSHIAHLKPSSLSSLCDRGCQASGAVQRACMSSHPRGDLCHSPHRCRCV